jgi:cyclase
MTRLFPVVWLFALPALAQQQDFSKVEIRTQQLAPTVYMLTGAGGNLGLSAGADAVFLVDDQFAPLTPRIEAAIAKITPKPVRFVLNTHWHFDHTGGNENLGKVGALIVAHENVRKRMSVENFIEFLGMKTQPDPKEALPVVTFTRDVTFHINGDEVHVMHVPNAHTDGDAIVHFTKSDVIHMGDVFFNKLYPFIDTSSGGRVEGVVAAVERALELAGPSTKIIPGHGPLASRADLQAYRDMLAAISGRIREQVRAGRSLEQVIEAKPTAEFDAAWGKGFLTPARFTEMLYKNLQAAR